jgi:hypothetical protein
MAPQFGLGKAPEVLSPVNVAAVSVGEHLRLQNQAVEITVSEQPGIAPESVQINRAATRDLLRDDLPRRRHPHHIGHWSGVHTPAAASGAQTVRICLAQLGSTDGCGLPQSSFHQPRLCRLVGPLIYTPGPRLGKARSKIARPYGD